MKIVKHILENKSEQIWSTAPSAPVFEALELMAEKDIGALVVLENKKIAGIFSERDYARKVILKGKTSKDTLVMEIMSSPVITVQPGQTVRECMAIMVREHIRHLPVVEKEQLTGIISIGDVVQAVITDQENALQRLEGAMLQSGDLLDDEL